MCDPCPSGFTGDGESCSDIDDCQGHPCGHYGNCTDTGTNSYDCACDAGYVFEAGAPGADCQEIRLCDRREDDCHVNATCTHTGPGQHSCDCNQGYSGIGRSCVDTDGCVPDPCFTDVNCTDIPAPGIGSFCDACPEGYSGSGLTGDCYDIDDCEKEGNGNCAVDSNVDSTESTSISEEPSRNSNRCVDRVAGYECLCGPGFELVTERHESQSQSDSLSTVTVTVAGAGTPRP